MFKMELVHTTHGLVPRTALKVEDSVYEDEKARYVQTKWYLGDELVRQDAWVNLKQGLTSQAEGGLDA